MPSRPRAAELLRWPALWAATALVYLAAAWVGLLPARHGVASPLWPPTALALFALARSPGLWPGVLAGTFLATVTRMPLAASLAISGGNTAEAVLGAWLLRRGGFDPSLSRLHDVYLLFFRVGLGATLVSPAVAIGALGLTGAVPGHDLLATGLVWWVGDLLSVLALAPVLFTATTPEGRTEGWLRTWLPRTVLPAATLMVLALRDWAPTTSHLPLYLVFPTALWLAVDQGPQAAAVGNLVVTVLVGLGYALRGAALGPVPLDLAEAELFLAALSVTTLALAALTRERAAGQRALAEREARLRVVLDRGPVALWTLDSELRVVSMEGRPEDTPDVPVGARAVDLVPDQREALRAMQEALAGRAAAFPLTWGGRQFDGLAQPWPTPNGKPGVLGLAVDVTNRHRAQALQQQLFENSPIATITVDTRLGDRVLAVNAAFRAQVGWAAEEIGDIRGWWLLAYPDPGYRARVQSDWSAVLTAAQAEGRDHAALVASVTCQDGRQRTFDVRTPVAGDVRFVTFDDVTERLRAEEALRESEVRYRLLVEDLNVGVVVFDGRSAPTTFNAVALDLLGLTVDQFLGRSSFDPGWDVIHEDGSPFPGPEHPVPASIATGRPVRNVVMGVFRPVTQDRAWILVNATPRLDAAGRVQDVLCTFVDVTARHQAEQKVRHLNESLERRVEERTAELAARESQMRDVMETLPGVLFQYAARADGSGDLLFVSPTVEELVGLDPQALREQLATRGWQGFTDEPEAVARAARPGLATGEPWVVDLPFSSPRRTEALWLRLRAVSRSDPRGVLVTGLLVDVTQSHAAEQRLAMLSRVAEQTADAVLVADVGGRVVYANPALEAASGFSEEELLGQPAYRVKGADWEHQAAAALAAGHHSETSLLLRKDGTTYYDEQTLTPLLDERGQVRHLVATGRDVTRRVVAEAHEANLRATIARAAAEWRATFDAIEMPILLVGPELRVRTFNRAARELAAPPAADLGGRALGDLGGDALWSRLAAVASQARLAGRAADQVVDDRGRSWDLFATQVEPGNAGGHGLIVLARDVTSLLELQDALRRSETMSAMGRIVAGVAHEVRNPLFAISSVLDAFEDEFGDQPGFEEYGLRLRREVARMSGLMQDLLEYGRPGSSTLARASLREVLQRALRSCRPQAQVAGVHLRFEFDAAIPELDLDTQRLAQVFQNLLENAVQHSRRSGTVVLQARRAEQQVECRVLDQGPGFRPEDLPHVFEPFFTRRRGGTGLGLAIVQRIVDQHHGVVSAANRPEGGAVTTVVLPCP